jgi:hypothetical protein
LSSGPIWSLAESSPIGVHFVGIRHLFARLLSIPGLLTSQTIDSASFSGVASIRFVRPRGKAEENLALFTSSLIGECRKASCTAASQVASHTDIRFVIRRDLTVAVDAVPPFSRPSTLSMTRSPVVHPARLCVKRIAGLFLALATIAADPEKSSTSSHRCGGSSDTS